MKLSRIVVICWLKLKTLWKPYGYFGNYSSWESAVRNSDGYDETQVIQRVLEASREVRDGKARYERDGVAFRDEFRWDLLPVFNDLIMKTGSLTVLDFGGALGSHYYPLKSRFGEGVLNWHILEQPAFIALGKQEFASSELHFHESLAELNLQPDVLLLGCVLPYLEKPYSVLDELLKLNPSYVLIDKHPVIDANEDRLTVQRIPPSIYKASYPAWFFSEKKFRAYMDGNYELVQVIDCDDIYNIHSRFKTYFYRRKA